MPQTDSKKHESPQFLRCYNCGRYLTPEQRAVGRYCSENCAEKYRRCSVCGGYVSALHVVGEEYCSRECAARFTVNRSYGPQALSIRAEEMV